VQVQLYAEIAKGILAPEIPAEYGTRPARYANAAQIGMAGRANLGMSARAKKTKSRAAAIAYCAIWSRPISNEAAAFIRLNFWSNSKSEAPPARSVTCKQ
jgi:hypothetical protein